MMAAMIKVVDKGGDLLLEIARRVSSGMRFQTRSGNGGRSTKASGRLPATARPSGQRSNGERLRQPAVQIEPVLMNQRTTSSRS